VTIHPVHAFSSRLGWVYALVLALLASLIVPLVAADSSVARAHFRRPSFRACNFRTRAVTAMVAIAVVLLGVAGVQFAAAPHTAKAAADVTTGTGGRFVATTGRILDTRNGTGGYTSPMPTGVWRSVAVTNQAGSPPQVYLRFR
jgi:hypothetical protein